MSNEALNHFMNMDVPDPTDFPPADVAPGLRQLDDALRCSICRELFSAPVTIDCGHGFCSLCIRAVIAEMKPEQYCPICRQSASEYQIRRNPALEEAVKAWNDARAYVLRLSKAEGEVGLRLTPNSSKEHPNDIRTPKKRKRSPELDNGNRSGRDGSPATDGMVKCPICNEKVPEDSINEHVDSDLRLGSGAKSPTSSKGKEEWSKLFDKGNAGASSSKTKGKAKDSDKQETIDDEPLPKVSYHTVKEKHLQKLLAEHNLPTNGDKNMLVARHQRWVMIYNANLDSSLAQRKVLDELRRELKRWEEEQRKKKKPIIPDPETHQKTHKFAFAQLVKDARPKEKSEKPKSNVNGDHDVSSTDMDDADGERQHQQHVPSNEVIVVDVD